MQNVFLFVSGRVIKKGMLFCKYHRLDCCDDRVFFFVSKIILQHEGIAIIDSEELLSQFGTLLSEKTATPSIPILNAKLLNIVIDVLIG